MTFFDYKAGQQIAAMGFPFAALIQAAMRQADSVNKIELQTAFPADWADLQARYNAPGGILPGEDTL